jgi:(S)-3,5-dihydroxyphenylglycine transaminase
MRLCSVALREGNLYDPTPQSGIAMNRLHHGRPLVTRVDPEATFKGPTLGSMNFLNEVVGRYPDAISFAAGRPPNQFLFTERVPDWFRCYVEYRSKILGRGDAKALWEVGQYADTSGIIQSLIARYLDVDGEGVVDSSDCVVTNGFQEALLIHLMRLARYGGAVVTLDPTYVGLTGAAMAAGVPIYAVRTESCPASGIQEGIIAAQRDGHAPIAIYLVPDFDNPSGHLLDLSQRTDVLNIAERYDAIVFEDAAYRVFSYGSTREPSLLSLDRSGRVFYLGTFSKMFLPGVRVGFSAGKPRGREALAEIASLKSFTSVTTSPIAQAIVGGFLIDVDCRVLDWNAPRIAFCRANRDAVLDALKTELGAFEDISWTVPTGGFFVVVRIPFEFDAADASDAAERYGVIVTPMTLFSPSGGSRQEIRLAFSNLSEASIREGVRRLANYLKERPEPVLVDEKRDSIWEKALIETSCW